MNKRYLAITLTVALALVAVAAVLLAPSALAWASDPLAVMDESGPPAPASGPGTAQRSIYGIDPGPELRAQAPKYIAEIERIGAEIDVPLPDRATAAYTVGDTLTWIASDFVDPMGKNFWWDMYETDYEVKAIKEHCEVWVQTDLNYYDADGTINSLHPDAKDPLYVTDERVEYLAQQCNDVIRPTDVAFFGSYDSRDGTAGWETALNYYYGTNLSEVDGKGDRIVILVTNIRTESFYDPVNNSGFYWGFYSPALNYYGNRNFITINSKAWNRYVGDTGNPVDSYQFDATIAHELLHLIHGDLAPSRDVWIQEGLAGYAEFLVGYFQNRDLGWRTAWQLMPENSLTMWSDQGEEERGADYQLVNAFMLYVTGRIGGVYTDTAKLAQEREFGILGFNKWLSDTAATNPDAVGLTFEILLEDFRVDMLYGGDTDGTQPVARWNGDFIGSYQSPLEKSGGPATSEAYLGLLRDNLDRQGYDSPGAPPFGTDFIEVCWSGALSTGTWDVALDGDETAPPTQWSTVAATDIYSPAAPASGDALYSDHTDLTDNSVVFGPLAVGASDALSFDHYYNIEEGWDFGFVQVTTDTTGMSGWASLALAGTTSSHEAEANPIIQANVPGFTGFSGGWLTATYDLGAEYAGEQILLAFRYSADVYTGGEDENYASGWAIDNVTVGATTLTTGAVGTGRSIEQVRGAGPKFSLEFLTWTNGDGVDVNNVYSVTLTAAQTGTLDLAAIAASDVGFDQAGERGVLMISSKLEYHYDLLHGGIRPAYADYALTGLPPSICMSDVDLYGDSHAGRSNTCAGGVITAAVHVDNLGSSPDVTATGPALVYVGVEIPDNATFKESVGGGAYTTDLSAVSSAFPAQPGVFWIGLVSRAADFAVLFTADATLVDGDRIIATVHFADGPTPDQYFSDDDSVWVLAAFGLSGFQVVDPVYPYGSARSSASVLNLSDSSRQVQLIADIPTGTTFVGVTGATDVVTSATQVTVTKLITPYADAGAADIAFEWQLGISYEVGDVVTSTAKLVDLQTGEVFALDDTAAVRDFPYKWYYPIVMESD